MCIVCTLLQLRISACLRTFRNYRLDGLYTFSSRVVQGRRKVRFPATYCDPSFTVDILEGGCVSFLVEGFEGFRLS